MKILVTGGNGFIGSNLIKKLLSEGHNVVSLDDLSTGLKEYEVEGCNYVYGDIENLLYWKGDNFDLVYHLAALARIQPSFDDPMETFRVDTFGVQIVAEWARQNDVKVVYAGSSSRGENKSKKVRISQLYRMVNNVEILLMWMIYVMHYIRLVQMIKSMKMLGNWELV